MFSIRQPVLLTLGVVDGRLVSALSIDPDGLELENAYLNRCVPEICQLIGPSPDGWLLGALKLGTSEIRNPKVWAIA